MPVTIRTEAGKRIELLNREIIGSVVRIDHEMVNALMKIAPGTELEVCEVAQKDGTLSLHGEKCVHCGIAATMRGVQPRDCTLIAASLRKIEDARVRERAEKKARSAARKARKEAHAAREAEGK